MIVFVFGLPGTGKNYVGDVLAAEMGFYHYDGDEALGDAVRATIEQGGIITDAQRSAYMDRIITRIKELQRTHERVVMCQALTKESMRIRLRQEFPEGLFIMVTAPPQVREQRLRSRAHFISSEYAKKVEAYYEEPRIPHAVVVNGGDGALLRAQLRAALGE